MYVMSQHTFSVVRKRTSNEQSGSARRINDRFNAGTGRPVEGDGDVPHS